MYDAETLREQKTAEAWKRIRSFLIICHCEPPQAVWQSPHLGEITSRRLAMTEFALGRVGHLHRHPIEGEVAGIIVGDVRDANAEVREVTA